ncbi:hypothetical protein [Providencia phage PSTCR7]|uniref:Uncharacterized protein n=1 Tax=Providencia phage PSTCR7 TaxID=2783549 RepID=A0A7S9SWL6_9CAUD|nr:hypothetical protein PQD10_gp70 [Providencia phage PSTCR7]QPI18522.1 hypothetical protein [Providencia phage PSTCR7]
MQDKIKNALKGLDVANEGQWTKEGLPNINFLKIVTGIPTLTREQVQEVAPNFTRDNPTVVEQQQVPEEQAHAANETQVEQPVVPVAPENSTQNVESDGANGNFEGTLNVLQNPLEIEYESDEQEQKALEQYKDELDIEINRLNDIKHNVVKRLDEFVDAARPHDAKTMQMAIQLMHKQEKNSKQVVEKTTMQQKYPLDRVKASNK